MRDRSQYYDNDRPLLVKVFRHPGGWKALFTGTSGEGYPTILIDQNDKSVIGGRSKVMPTTTWPWSRLPKWVKDQIRSYYDITHRL